jgi:hypothetical protein
MGGAPLHTPAEAPVLIFLPRNRSARGEVGGRHLQAGASAAGGGHLRLSLLVHMLPYLSSRATSGGIEYQLFPEFVLRGLLADEASICLLWRRFIGCLCRERCQVAVARRSGGIGGACGVERAMVLQA